MQKLFSFLIVLLFSTSLVAQIPDYFDLRDYDGANYVSSVKTQQGGTCWTHGTMASIESNLMITNVWADNGETGEPNLAEYHLDWWNGYNEFHNDDIDDGSGLEVHMGGDYRVSTAYLSRGEGAVRDIDAQSYDTAPERWNASYHYYYPRNVQWFSMDDDLNGITDIKQQLMDYGAIATCIAWDYAFVSGTNFYQPSSSTMLPNHSVTIVGWDNNHVISGAPDNGAWIVKNSWGSGWGDAGYFWVSFYDKWSCREPDMGAVSFIDVEPMQFSKIYFTNVDSVDFKIKIYSQMQADTFTNALVMQTGFVQHKGFHTIDLDVPVELLDGDDFYIYLYLSDGGQPYDRTSDVPVLLDDPTLLKSARKTLVYSTANEGESFYFDSLWHDFYNYDDPSGFDQTGNFCIKGLAQETLDNIDIGAMFHILNQNGMGIQNASVTFNNSTQTTDKQGDVFYANQAYNQTNVSVTISADGYYPIDTVVNISDVTLVQGFQLQSLTSLQETNLNLTLYPNPANDFISVSGIATGFEYQIFDVSGRNILNGSSLSNQQIDISSLQNGFYNIKIHNKTSNQVIKFIKK